MITQEQEFYTSTSVATEMMRYGTVFIVFDSSNSQVAIITIKSRRLQRHRVKCVPTGSLDTVGISSTNRTCAYVIVALNKKSD